MTRVYYDFEDGTRVKTLQEARDLKETKGEFKQVCVYWLNESETFDTEGGLATGYASRSLPMTRNRN